MQENHTTDPQQPCRRPGQCRIGAARLSVGCFAYCAECRALDAAMPAATDAPAAAPVPAGAGGEAVGVLEMLRDKVSGSTRSNCVKYFRLIEVVTHLESVEARAESAERELHQLRQALAAREGALADFKAEMLAGLKEAHGQGDWFNIYMMMEELAADD